MPPPRRRQFRPKKYFAGRLIDGDSAYLTAETIHHAIRSLTPDAQTQSHLRRHADVTPYFRKDSTHPPSPAEVVSHAVNNLLCVINANADVLADHFADSNLAARSVHEIKKAAKSAADLIRSL
jgi:predicted ATPase with chaperone activity